MSAAAWFAISALGDAESGDYEVKQCPGFQALLESAS